MTPSHARIAVRLSRPATALVACIVAACAATPATSPSSVVAPSAAETAAASVLSPTTAPSKIASPRPTANTGQPAGSIRIAMTGPPGRYDPAEETAKAGAIIFYLPNKTGGQHTLAITNKPLTFADSGTPTDVPLAISDLVDAGKAITFTTTLAAGSYTYYCTIGTHARDGMVGKLTVGP
jgi:plastocyanin